MLVFIIKRLGNAVLVMLSVALIAFLIFRLAGDPVELMVGEQTSQEDRAALRERLGLNDSLPTQYLRFVKDAAEGNFGVSYRNGQQVLPLIAERFPATLELVLVATVISLVVGLPLGVLTAIRRGKWYTEGLQFLSIVGVSLPSFVVGILLILVFSVSLGWAPAFGRGDVVQLGNERGEVRLHAKIGGGTRRGVVIAEGLWPNGAHLDGEGINVLTGADAVAPYGGAAFHDNRVWVKRAP